MHAPTKQLKEFDEIWIGKPQNLIRAIVCSQEITDEYTVEVVYLDGGKAINENVRWNGTHWEFISNTPCGGYADKNDRLSTHVTLLKNKRYIC